MIWEQEEERNKNEYIFAVWSARVGMQTARHDRREQCHTAVLCAQTRVLSLNTDTARVLQKAFWGMKDFGIHLAPIKLMCTK